MVSVVSWRLWSKTSNNGQNEQYDGSERFVGIVWVLPERLILGDEHGSMKHTVCILHEVPVEFYTFIHRFSVGKVSEKADDWRCWRKLLLCSHPFSDTFSFLSHL